MLVATVMNSVALYGLLQVIDNRSNQPFIKVKEDDAQRLFDTLNIAIRQRMRRIGDNQLKKAIKYDDLVADGVLSHQELTDCILKAREHAETVKHLLMADYQIRSVQISPSWPNFLV